MWECACGCVMRVTIGEQNSVCAGFMCVCGARMCVLKCVRV